MLVELHLTSEQEALLEPIVRATSKERKNVFFVATASPDFGAWRFQVITIPARIGAKVLRLLNSLKIHNE